MLSLTRKSDYALVALTHLARERDSVASAREIAETYRVPQAILMNVLKALSSHGVLDSVRGARGGYRLAMHPDEITMRTVVSAIEGPIRLFQCALSGQHGEKIDCDQLVGCPIMGPARKMNERLQQFLDDVSLAELMEGGNGESANVEGVETTSKEFADAQSVSG